jgi:hypothetical protein
MIARDSCWGSSAQVEQKFVRMVRPKQNERAPQPHLTGEWLGDAHD